MDSPHTLISPSPVPTAASAPPLLTAHDIAVKQRLRALSFTIHAGEVWAVIGANGAGKTTLLKTLAGLLPCRGQIHFAGQNLHELPAVQRARHIGFLPQHGHCAWDMRVDDVVALGRLPWGDAALHSAKAQQAVNDALEACELTALRERRIESLSGGEQARVWLARVLAGQPQLLLADEAAASLDIHQQENLMALFVRHAKHSARAQASILSVHDFSLALRHANRFLLLHHGQILACGRAEQVFTPAHLHRAFQGNFHVDLQHRPPLFWPCPSAD